MTRRAYHLYGKPGNSGENSNGTVHPRGNLFLGITFLPKRPKYSVPFVWISSARLHVERKRKICPYFVNGTTQCRSYFRCQKQYRYHLTETFHRNFRTNGKRSSTTRSLSEFVSGTSLGSLSNYDGDGSEDGKKAIGLDWQNNNPARASRFFVHFFAINARLQRKLPNFMFCGGREHKTTIFFFFCEARYSPLPSYDKVEELE